MQNRIYKAIKLRFRRLKKFFRHGILKLILPRDFYFSTKGVCMCCDQEVVFTSYDSWLRDHFLCSKCRCIPRERALMLTIEEFFPNWVNLHVHESSPGKRGGSLKLKKHVKNYMQTQFYPKSTFGTIVQGFRNENLESQTFEDATFDLVITQDVMEHIYHPHKAFKEIARTLKPGGAYVFTVPLVNKHKKSEVWATLGDDGNPVFLKTPEYHGNPVDAKGSPVTMHWGFDIVDFIKESSGMNAQIISNYSKRHGILGEYNEVVICYKK